jgi:far upstream element-binding protein
MPSAAEEAIARAKAIAARLAGTAAVSATTPQASAAPVPPPTYAPATAPAASAAAAAPGVVHVDAATAKAAEEALAMALGPSAGAATIPAAAPAAAKRKRWSDDAEDPAAKKPLVDPDVARTADLAQQALLAAMAGGGAAAAGGKVTRKLPIPTEKFPGYNFVGLLIGPGGSKQRELVQKAGGNVKISVRGDANGGSEPLHVLLEGSKECVDKADEMISELLKDPKKADEEKVCRLFLLLASNALTY